MRPHTIENPETATAGRSPGATWSVTAAALAAAFVTAAPAAAQPVLGGFVEAVQAVRVEENAALGDAGIGERSYPRSEVRAQLTARHARDRETLFLRADIVGDARGVAATDIDLREAYVSLRLADWLDLKAGRQVATWGTGDLVFANDLFAKDWVAFFTGLDDTYLKRPQDLLRLSAYVRGVTAEAALAPRFTPDNLPSGERLSVFDPFTGRTVGAAGAPAIVAPPARLENGEVFARLSGLRRSAEWALYGYAGRWPTPRAATAAGTLRYPRLASAGASLRAPLGSILAHAEAAMYVSRDDTQGSDPRIANSQLIGFAGVERGLGPDWTLGAQYVFEWMQDHDAYVANLPPGAFVQDELRSTVTARIGRWARHRTLHMSVFGYWGVTDEDWHVRPSASYDVTDAVRVTAGASLVGGQRPDTLFGQFQDNSNAFGRLRFSF